MAELADEYGHDFTGGYFAHGWSQGEVAVAALTACGSECTPEALLEALGDIGEFTPTASATAGPMRFSPESRIAVTTVQLNRWDSAQGKTIAVGEPITVEPRGSY